LPAKKKVAQYWISLDEYLLCKKIKNGKIFKLSKKVFYPDTSVNEHQGIFSSDVDI